MALKTIVTEMYDVVSKIIDSTDTIYASLLNNSQSAAKEAEDALIDSVSRTEPLTDMLLKEKQSDSSALPYVGVPVHLQMISRNMYRIVEATRKKIKEDVLFSDRAFSELEYLFERVRDILVHLRDMMLARNTLVARHLEESERAIMRTANEYATKHEERLIEGLCLSKASPLFLEMLDAVKEISSHARDIGRELGG